MNSRIVTDLVFYVYLKLNVSIIAQFCVIINFRNNLLVMMSMINSSSFNKKIKTIFFLAKLLHSEFRHFSKTWLVGEIFLSVHFIFQIVIGKQTDNFT